VKVEEEGNFEDRECDGEGWLLDGSGNSGNVKEKGICFAIGMNTMAKVLLPS
jgi:hypothetical protein